MARLDPELIPDRFELDRYARRMRDQEFGRLIRAVVDGVRRWAGRLSHAAPSARGLRAN